MGARRLGLGRMVLVVFLVVGCTLVFGGAVAYAAAPGVSGESVSSLGSSSIRLSAQVNPNGIATTYRFEYGTSVAYGSSTAPVGVGSGSEAVGVVAQFGDLQAETVYHFRVVATNEASETTVGVDMVFQTLPAGLLGLPDGRGYEMVSPVVNEDSSVNEPALAGGGVQWSSSEGYGPITKRLFQAADDGSGIVYVGDPSVGGNGSVGINAGNQYLARRTEAGGWSVGVIQPARFQTPVYQAFSSDLSVGVLDSLEALSVGAPGGGYDVLYSTLTSDDVYNPFFAVTPTHRVPEPPGQFEANGVPSSGAIQGIAYAGASSDMSHLLFEANDSLTPLAEQAVPTFTQNDLYDSVKGTPYLVDVLPDGKADAGAAFGGLPSSEPDFSRVISADGSRVFWTDLNANVLYVRENDTMPQSPLGAKGECTVAADACTVQVDASHGPGGGGGGVYWTASSDGSRVFFTDENALTSDSTAVSGAPDLYEYDVDTGALHDLSVDGNAGEHANVRGVIGASDDGSYVYFVAGGALAPGASPEICEQPSGSCNLYVLHSGESVRLVAVLSAKDNETSGSTVGAGDWSGNLALRQAQVTPDGRGLVFMSFASITGYENDGFSEIFAYDASSGELWCASCNPSGETPVTPRVAELPVSWDNTYMHRLISSDGSRVFFDSGEALVAQDTNGQVDAYEWERDGSGSCQRPQGCIYLLSGGSSQTNSYFLDAGVTGDDVFISTRAQLAAQDQNDVYDVYDARVGAVEPASPPVCTGSGCQGLPGAPPIFATPSSVTFSGVGNFAASTKTVAKPKKKAKKPKRKKHKKGKRSRAAHARRAGHGAGSLHRARGEKGGRS